MGHPVARSRRAKTDKKSSICLDGDMYMGIVWKSQTMIFEPIFNEFRLAPWRFMSNNICTLLG